MKSCHNTITLLSNYTSNNLYHLLKHLWQTWASGRRSSAATAISLYLSVTEVSTALFIEPWQSAAHELRANCGVDQCRLLPPLANSALLYKQDWDCWLQGRANSNSYGSSCHPTATCPHLWRTEHLSPGLCLSSHWDSSIRNDFVHLYPTLGATVEWAEAILRMGERWACEGMLLHMGSNEWQVRSWSPCTTLAWLFCPLRDL